MLVTMADVPPVVVVGIAVIACVLGILDGTTQGTYLSI